jgi:tRNA pseudouridine38-40 synthase
MPNIKLTIQYDGTDFFGWQKQVSTPRTIQQTLEQTLAKILCHPVSLFAAGRTDSGVHARGQIANFKTDSDITPEKIRTALNALLPPAVKILRAVYVPASFHSTLSSREKTYRYTIHNGRCPDPFKCRYEWFYSRALAELDAGEMNNAAALLAGRHDFASFRAAGSGRRKTTVRSIRSIMVFRRGERIYIDVAGPGFLYKMIRGIAGTLVEVGRRKLLRDEFRQILDAKNRSCAGPTAPACGLCLLRVKY